MAARDAFVRYRRLLVALAVVLGIALVAIAAVYWAEPEFREWGLRMVVVARTIERIGDRAVDIGEQTAYLLTAEFREFTDASHPVS